MNHITADTSVLVSFGTRGSGRRPSEIALINEIVMDSYTLKWQVPEKRESADKRKTKHLSLYHTFAGRVSTPSSARGGYTGLLYCLYYGRRIKVILLFFFFFFCEKQTKSDIHVKVGQCLSKPLWLLLPLWVPKHIIGCKQSFHGTDDIDLWRREPWKWLGSAYGNI